MPLVYSQSGFTNVLPAPITGQGAPPASFIGQLGQQYFDTTTSPPTEYVFNGQTWVSAITSGNLTATFASPPPIGSTTPNTGAFTTLSATSSITAGTTITATLGNITATNGNIVKGTAGNKDIYSSVASTTAAGANSAGTVTLVGGTATISTTAVTANSIIRLYRQGVGATGAAALGLLSIGTVTAGVSFIINAVQAANATALQASDVSIIAWEIVN